MALTKIGSIGINTGIQFAGVTTIATLNASDNVLSVGGTVNFVSDVSIGGTVSIAGTLTYEDVTNVDAVGLITARNGIVVGGGITLSKDGDVFSTGITTVGTGLSMADSVPATFGDSGDLKISHNGTDSLIQDNGTGNLKLTSNGTAVVLEKSNAEPMVRAYTDGAVELFYDNSKKIETTNTGAVVTGILTATNNLTAASINVGSNIQVGNAGIITATNLELAIPTSRRNFFINGGMYVAARGTVTGLNAGGFGGPDHIKLVNNLGIFTVSQGNENESPRSEGFTYCYKLNCTSASGPSASNYVYLHHEFSGYDLQLLRYGYTNPHPITISFWAKSNKTGNFTVTFRTVAGVNRLISKVLTISDTNWNFYSVTFVGDTSAVNVTAGGAYILEIWLDGGSNYTGGTVQTSWSAKDNADRGAGSTLNIASSTSNYFY